MNRAELGSEVSLPQRGMPHPASSLVFATKCLFLIQATHLNLIHTGREIHTEKEKGNIKSTQRRDR